MKSKISIIIPIYNNSGTIDKCLVSIFSQTFKDFEIIVVNDGSTDNLRKKLRRWESKIKIYHQKLELFFSRLSNAKSEKPLMIVLFLH